MSYIYFYLISHILIYDIKILLDMKTLKINRQPLHFNLLKQFANTMLNVFFLQFRKLLKFYFRIQRAKEMYNNVTNQNFSILFKFPALVKTSDFKQHMYSIRIITSFLKILRLSQMYYLRFIIPRTLFFFSKLFPTLIICLYCFTFLY